jgi:hypothetical protein
VAVDAAGRHAPVGRLDDHRHAFGLQHLIERMGDLVGQPLLQLEPAGEGVGKAHQLGDPDHPPLGPVGDMGVAVDRREMMLAGRDDRDVPQEDGLVIAFGLAERALEQRGRVDRIAGEPFAIGPRDPRRRVAQPFAGRIVAGRGDQGAHRPLDPGAARTGGRVDALRRPVERDLPAATLIVHIIHAALPRWSEPAWMPAARSGSREPGRPRGIEGA